MAFKFQYSLGLLICGLLPSCSTTTTSPPISLAFYNSVNTTLLASPLPSDAKIYRVELPAELELIATAPTAKSVVFSLDGLSPHVDDSPPFTVPVPNRPFTAHITAFTEKNGQGRLLAKMDQEVNIATDGMPTPQDRLNDEATLSWLDNNLDRVMQRKQWLASNGMNMPYRLFVPPQYSQEVHYPLVVFLHGRGQRGNQNEAHMFNTVGLFNGPNSIVAPNGQHHFPALVLVPQCSDRTTTEEWAHWLGNSPAQPFAGLNTNGSYPQAPEPSKSGAAALELIKYISQQYSVDTSRIYLTGISMGGFGTWEFTTREPNLFAAAVPMAGYSNPQKASEISHIPFWIFHGNLDEYNPVAGSRNMYQRLKSLGANVQYTELEDFTHNASFKEAWKNPDILSWMFAQKQQVPRP